MPDLRGNDRLGVIPLRVLRRSWTLTDLACPWPQGMVPAVVQRMLTLAIYPRFRDHAIGPRAAVAFVFRVEALVLPFVAAMALPACSDSDSITTTPPPDPLTGIVIDPNAFTTTHGCGAGPDDIYEYAAILSIPLDAGLPSPLSGAYVWGVASPCDASVTVPNVCTYGADGGLFEVAVYAFTEAEWNQTLEPDGGSGVGYLINYGNMSAESGGAVDMTGKCAPAIPAAKVEDTPEFAAAGWRANCTVVQDRSAPVPAVCDPLEAVSP
jgi:hypothetical protein